MFLYNLNELKGIIIVFVIVEIFILIILEICSNSPKIGGRDIVVSFGDGSWKILKSGDKLNRTYSLHYYKEQLAIAQIIEKYKVDKNNHYIYLISKEQPNSESYQHTVVNYQTNYYQKFSYNELSDGLKAIFEQNYDFEILN